MMNRGLVNTAAILAAASLLGACNTGPKSEPGPAGKAAAKVEKTEGAINGTLLYATEARPGHLVEFYDFGNGSTAIHESYAMELGGAGFMEDKASPDDLASVYRLLNPKETVVPTAILAADARAKRFVQDRAALVAAEAAKRGMSIDQIVKEPALELPARERNISPILSAAASNCSPTDFYDDNWGVEWFYDNVCNERNIRICHTNRFTDQYTGKSSSLRYKQMEGDFNVAGHMKGRTGSDQCCFLWCDCGIDWHTDFDISVRPRHVEMFTYTRSAQYRDIDATSPCGHAHTAALHN